MSPGPKPVDPASIRVCECGYRGRVDSFPISRTYQNGRVVYRKECKDCHNRKKRERNNRSHEARRSVDRSHGRRRDLIDAIEHLLKSEPGDFAKIKYSHAAILAATYADDIDELGIDASRIGVINHLFERTARALTRGSPDYQC